MKQSFIKVPGMHSLASANTLSSAIKSLNGVEEVNIDYQKSTLGVFHNQDEVGEKDIENKIESLGYRICPGNTL